MNTFWFLTFQKGLWGFILYLYYKTWLNLGYGRAMSVLVNIYLRNKTWQHLNASTRWCAAEFHTKTLQWNEREGLITTILHLLAFASVLIHTVKPSWRDERSGISTFPVMFPQISERQMQRENSQWAPPHSGLFHFISKPLHSTFICEQPPEDKLHLFLFDAVRWGRLLSYWSGLWNFCQNIFWYRWHFLLTFRGLTYPCAQMNWASVNVHISYKIYAYVIPIHVHITDPDGSSLDTKMESSVPCPTINVPW